VAIDFHGHCNLRVPENRHGNARMNIEGHQQRCARMSSVMKMDGPHAGPGRSSGKHPGQVGRFNRGSESGGENQIEPIFPYRTRCLTLFFLLPFPHLQSCNCNRRKDEKVVGILRLGVPVQQFRASSLELPFMEGRRTRSWPASPTNKRCLPWASCVHNWPDISPDRRLPSVRK
jgi:hypothetical protein